VAAERYTAVFTGLFDLKKPGEYTYLTTSGDPLGPGGSYTLCRGSVPAERLERGISFRDLPEGCRELISEIYAKLWGL
jgi:hypothetical protein